MSNHEAKFLPIRDAELFTGIKAQTLRKLFDEDILYGYRTKAGQRYFSREAISRFCEITPNINNQVIDRKNYSPNFANRIICNMYQSNYNKPATTPN